MGQQKTLERKNVYAQYILFKVDRNPSWKKMNAGGLNAWMQVDKSAYF